MLDRSRTKAKKTEAHIKNSKANKVKQASEKYERSRASQQHVKEFYSITRKLTDARKITDRAVRAESGKVLGDEE